LAGDGVVVDVSAGLGDPDRQAGAGGGVQRGDQVVRAEEAPVPHRSVDVPRDGAPELAARHVEQPDVALDEGGAVEMPLQTAVGVVAVVEVR
jgi:hypothetical protein